jgi:uncharacterized repeat protein (TIGR01451 family)
VRAEDPIGKILSILEKHPEGLTISSLAKLSGFHRHTSAKYAKELAKRGKVFERKIGSAKLYYSKQVSNQESKLRISRKGEKGIKLIPILAIAFLLLSQASIIAQNLSGFSNFSNISLISGMFAESFQEKNVENITTSTTTTSLPPSKEIVETPTTTSTTTTLPLEGGNEKTVGTDNLNDTLAPSYSEFGASKEKARVGEKIEFFALWKDDSGLNEWVFSWNSSGVWENESHVFASSYDEETKVLTRKMIQVEDSFNNSSTSLSDNTSTTFCLLSLGSLDQIGALLKAKDNANNGASFLCGDIFLASSKNCEYSNSETSLITFLSDINASSTSDCVNLANLDIFCLRSFNSENTNSGTSNLKPCLRSSLISSSVLEPFLKDENNTLVSMIKNIYNNPCLLATLSFNSSPSFKASLAVNFDLDAIFFNFSKAISSSSLSRNASINALENTFDKLTSLANFSHIFSYSFGISNSTFILIPCSAEFINLPSCSNVDETSICKEDGKIYKLEWKYLKDLRYEDEVATLSSSKIKFERPIRIISLPYDDGIYKIDGEINLYVTPDHKVFARVDYPFDFFKKIKDLIFDVDLNEFSFIEIEKAYELAKSGYGITFLDENLKPIYVKEISFENYKGRIYDITVPSHVILVKRFGKAVWSSNLDVKEAWSNVTKTVDSVGTIAFKFYASDLAGNWAETEVKTIEIDELGISENLTVPNISEVILNVSVESPSKITRGEVVAVRATITNTGSAEAKNVLLTWKLPEGFEIISGDQTQSCGILEPNASCTSVITVQSSLSAELGKNEIKVVVSYE